MNKAQQLTIDSDVFDRFRCDFNAVLNRTLLTMHEKQSSEAEINVKIKMELESINVPDENYEITKAIRPNFEHKVSSVLAIKTERKGVTVEDFIFEFDEEQNCFIAKPVIDPQMSIFDDEIQEQPTENDNIVQLPIKQELPPAAQEDDFIDAEYKEIIDEENHGGYDQ